MRSGAKPVRVLLADDHTLVRAGIRSLLEKLPAVQVVGEATEGRQALDLVRLHQPDIVLMDIGMPGVNGLEATANVVRDFPAVRVIILSMHSHDEYVLGALRAGASGYLLKRSATEELGLAIQAVLRNKSYLSSLISARFTKDRVKNVSTKTAPLSALTPRQRQVLRLIAEGKTTKEAAFLQGVSAKTIEFHRAQLMQRLNIRDLAGLVRFAIRIGMVPLEADDGREPGAKTSGH